MQDNSMIKKVYSMQIETLLDKKEALQVNIIRLLLCQTQTTTKQALAQKVKLTQNALKEYLFDIVSTCQSLGQHFDITTEEKTLAIQFSSDINFDKIVIAYVNQSLAYQILRFILEHKKVSIFQLSNEFNSSEATIFRKLRDINQILKPFHIKIKNGQLVGDELQIRYFYYCLFSIVDTEFSSDDISVSHLMANIQPEFRYTFSKVALKRLSCWLFVTRFRLSVANHENSRFFEIQDRFTADPLYQKLGKIIHNHLEENATYVGKYEGAMFYCFFISFDILGVDNFSSYDLTRRKKISTAMLDTYSREIIVSYYGYQRLSISDEKNLAYKLSQIHTRVLCFAGEINLYEQNRIHNYFQSYMTPEMTVLLSELINTAQERLALTDTSKAYLWTNYANILVSINLSLYKTLTVGIDLDNLFSLSDALYHFLLSELSGIPQVRFEKYHEHAYYDLILTTREKPITQTIQYYFLSEFISPYDIENIKILVKQIKHQKNNYQK